MRVHKGKKRENPISDYIIWKSQGIAAILEGAQEKMRVGK